MSVEEATKAVSSRVNSVRSASGRSAMRPYLDRLAERGWLEFAVLTELLQRVGTHLEELSVA